MGTGLEQTSNTSDRHEKGLQTTNHQGDRNPDPQETPPRACQNGPCMVTAPEKVLARTWRETGTALLPECRLRRLWNVVQDLLEIRAARN